MKPWVLLDTAEVPGNGGKLQLWQRDTEFSIRADRNDLMNSRTYGSEEALARIACGRINSRVRPRVLIGGLGMGFTLRAALDALGRDAHVIVAELVPAVVAWNRGPLAHVSGHSLTDARVDVREVDVARLLRNEPYGYDAVLLDVDNGPEGLTRRANDRLYDRDGLSAIHTTLRPRGVLAVWSASPDARFTTRLRKAGFAVDDVRVPAHGLGGARHTIWVATRTDRKAESHDRVAGGRH